LDGQFRAFDSIDVGQTFYECIRIVRKRMYARNASCSLRDTDQEHTAMSPDDSVSAASSTESVKSKFCTICGSRTGPDFRFCADCGAEVTVSLSTPAAPAMANARPGATEQLTPLPTTAPESAPGGARRKRRRKAWYKRPLVIVPVALLGVLLIATSVVAYRTMSAFNDVQSISTPPPEVSASILGADRELVIDTGPAQQAIRD